MMNERPIGQATPTVTELEGAATADTGRLIAAAEKAGITYAGCDTPDHLADRVVEMQAQIDSLHDDLNVFLAKDSLLNGETNLLCAKLEDTVFRRDTRIAELETAYQHTVEDNVDLVRQLDWIKENHPQIYLMAAQEAGE
jgi:hypothetical protein